MAGKVTLMDEGSGRLTADRCNGMLTTTISVKWFVNVVQKLFDGLW